MPSLIAVFKIDLPQGYFISLRSAKNRHDFKCSLRGKDVSIRLNRNFESFSHINPFAKKTDPIHLRQLLLEVRGDEVTLPDSNSRKSICEYFGERRESYALIACEVVNRLIRYFKYKLGNPNLREMDLHHYSILNPKWKDDTGVEYVFPIDRIPIEQMPAQNRFGVQALPKRANAAFQEYLNKPDTPELFEEFLSDAQTAIFQNNYRRAVLELAIVCEITVKQKFSDQTSPAFQSFEYFTEVRNHNIPIKDRIDKTAKEPFFFGRSFKDEHPDEHREIDYLFRCRNQIAHRGLLIFKDRHHLLQSVDQVTLERWWDAVQVLLKWLKSL